MEIIDGYLKKKVFRRQQIEVKTLSTKEHLKKIAI